MSKRRGESIAPKSCTPPPEPAKNGRQCGAWVMVGVAWRKLDGNAGVSFLSASVGASFLSADVIPEVGAQDELHLIHLWAKPRCVRRDTAFKWWVGL